MTDSKKEVKDSKEDAFDQWLKGGRAGRFATQTGSSAFVAEPVPYEREYNALLERALGWQPSEAAFLGEDRGPNDKLFAEEYKVSAALFCACSLLHRTSTSART